MNCELSFFKIVTSCEKMGLPRGQMQELLDDVLILRDVYNNLWALEIERDGDSLYFNKGWPQFYRENCLEPQDALVFLHHHHNLFEFRLNGSDGCEKKGVGGPRVSVKEEYEEEEEEQEQEMGSDENTEEYIDEDDEEDYVNEEEESEEEEQSFKLKRSITKDKGKVCYGCGKDMSQIPASPIRRFKEENESKDYDGDDEDGIERMEEEEASDSYDEYGIERMEEEEEAEDTRKVEFTSSKKTYIKKKRLEYYGADIFELGLAPRPKNPYFVSISRQARGHHLCIPKEVIKDYKLNTDGVVKLVDGSGRQWDAGVNKWKDGRVWCNRGWRSLCEMNNIGVDDPCICEFVQHQQALHILVQPLSL